MANFSSNAVRHLYVVPQAVSILNTKLNGTEAPGTLSVQNKADKLWFEYISPNFKGVVRSDLIDKEKVTNAL